MVFLVIYKNMKSLVIVIQNDSECNLSGVLLKCLRRKNCEYITVFILFYPCGLFTTTIIHPIISK